jgi:hypothetical protein
MEKLEGEKNIKDRLKNMNHSVSHIHCLLFVQVPCDEDTFVRTCSRLELKVLTSCVAKTIRSNFNFQLRTALYLLSVILRSPAAFALSVRVLA